MNERILELVEQAANEYTQNFSWEHLLQIDKDIFEKFADMIVRECAKVADNHMSGPGCVIRDNIKEHFGVEE